MGVPKGQKVWGPLNPYTCISESDVCTWLHIATQKASSAKFQHSLCSWQHCNTRASAPNKKCSKSSQISTQYVKKPIKTCARHIWHLKSSYRLHFFPHSPPPLLFSPCAFQWEQTYTQKSLCECTAWSYPRCMSSKSTTHLISSSPEQPSWDGHYWAIKHNLGFWPELSAQCICIKNISARKENETIYEHVTCCLLALTVNVETDSLLLWGWSYGKSMKSRTIMIFSKRCSRL